MSFVACRIRLGVLILAKRYLARNHFDSLAVRCLHEPAYDTGYFLEYSRLSMSQIYILAIFYCHIFREKGRSASGGAMQHAKWMFGLMNTEELIIYGKPASAPNS